MSIALAIGWEDSAGNRHIVERSVRFYSVAACRQGNASTFTFLTQDDLTTLGDLHCSKIFLAIATVRPGHSPAEGTAGRGTYTATDRIKIKYYNLSVTPLHAGNLV